MSEAVVGVVGVACCHDYGVSSVKAGTHEPEERAWTRVNK